MRSSDETRPGPREIRYRCDEHGLADLPKPCSLPHHRPDDEPAEITGLRSLLMNAAEEQPMPNRFSSRPAATGPGSCIITDHETGRTTCVSLSAYRDVRKALNNLFACEDNY